MYYDIQATYNNDLYRQYNMGILNKISIDREIELRKAVVSLQKELRRKRIRSREEIELLYSNILKEIKRIYESTTNEIDQRKSELMDRIMLSIANCDYKHAQLLELKLKLMQFHLKNIKNYFHNLVIDQRIVNYQKKN